MSQEQIQVEEKTQKLLQGPLKHVRAAALAAALLPLASVAVSSASPEFPNCGSGGICGFVFDDANHDGIQDAGETGIEGAKVFLIVGGTTYQTETGPDGTYYFSPDTGITSGSTYPIGVQIPQGMQPSPANAGGDDTADSDGVSDTKGFSVSTMTLTGLSNPDTDFGFFPASALNPGTGTPGYWKNHPEAWPVQSITIGYKIVGGTKVGGVSYSIGDAIAILGNVGKDKRTTMFSSLVPAMLNVLIGNDNSCVASTIDAANAWFADYLPMSDASKKLAASSSAWTIGEPLHQQMDAYNNGRLCAPHRD